jgi:hypothetical protein
MNEFEKAFADTSDAIRLDPEYARPYEVRGFAWGQMKEYDNAILLIRPWEEPATRATETPLNNSKRRSAFRWYLVAIFLGHTVFFTLIGSLSGFSWKGRSFVSVLSLGNVCFGFTMGIIMTVLYAVLLRAVTARIRMFDRTEFLDRFDKAASKLRHRCVEMTDRSLVYEPRSLVRMQLMRIYVAIGNGEALVTGPDLTLAVLKKEIEKT